LLRAAGFVTAVLCDRLGCAQLHQLAKRRKERRQGVELESGLDVLVRLFLNKKRVDGAEARRLAYAELLGLLVDHGLLIEESGSLLSTVFLYPFHDLWLISNRSVSPGEEPFELRRDAVYPVLNEGTVRLTELLPATPCEHFLEACGGAGGIGLQGAQTAAWRVTSSDILERCSHFAPFNAALTGVENFSAVSGDLYAVTPGMRFDRIAAHPPYVPGEEVEMVFRDGVVDGVQIVRRLISELPDAPGAGCICFRAPATGRTRCCRTESAAGWGKAAGSSTCC
jgi:hypothetical protein